MSLTLLYKDQHALIEIDEAKKYLQLTWLQHPTSEIFQHLVTLAFNYAVEKEITLWLCDMRKLIYLLMSDQNWLVREIYAALDPTKQHECAYLVSKEDLELYVSFRIQDLVEADPHLNSRLQIEIFFEKSLALGWLLNHT